jgi:hypothetical protein
MATCHTSKNNLKKTFIVYIRVNSHLKINKTIIRITSITLEINSLNHLISLETWKTPDSKPLTDTMNDTLFQLIMKSINWGKIQNRKSILK